MPNTAKTSGKKHMMSIVNAVNQPKTADVIRLLVIHNESTYQEALLAMEWLMLNAPDTSDNPYQNFMTLLSQAIEQYEVVAYPLPEASPIDVIRFLLEQHSLKQKDLALLLNVSPGLVSDLLSEKKNLTKEHIEIVSKHFKVSPAVFFSGV